MIINKKKIIYTNFIIKYLFCIVKNGNQIINFVFSLIIYQFLLYQYLLYKY